MFLIKRKQSPEKSRSLGLKAVISKAQLEAKIHWLHGKVVRTNPNRADFS